MRSHEPTSGDDRKRSKPPELPEFGDDFFERMVAAANDAVVTLDAEGVVVYANEAIERLLGHPPAAVGGRPFTEFVPDRLRDRYRRQFDRYVEGDGDTPLCDETFEMTCRTADGEQRRLSISWFEHGIDGRTLFTGFVRDASDSDATDRRLREEEALTEEIFDTSPIAFTVRDAEGELLRANRRAAELVGVGSDRLPDDVEDHEESSAWQLYDAAGEPISWDEYPVGRVFETGEPVENQEVIVERADDERVYLSVSATPVEDDGELRRVVSVADDVTELKETQVELERRRTELETELSEMFSRVTDAFFALNDDWEFTYVNDEARELLWRTEGDLVGKNIWEEFPEAAGSTFQREYERAMATQEPVTFVEHYQPLSAWYEVRAYPSESGLSVYFQDVADRIERERELERYETIVETVEDGIYVVGTDGTFSIVNSSFAEMMGYDRAELLGSEPSMLYDEEIADQVAERQREMLDGGRVSATITHSLRRKDGETFPLETTFVVRETDDGPERVGVSRDITERKERERELRERNERLDAFASMLAHELRNPLEIAQIYFGMGVDQSGDEAASAFGEVEDALDRIEQMIETLLVVTRQGGAVDTTDVVDLGEVAAEWWADVDPEGTLVVETDRQIRADPSRLRQLLENLYRNAAEHAGPDVTVRVGDLPGDSPDPPGGGFFVEDDGPGIPEDDRERVFDPGYSTSNVGIGFGLAVVRQLVDAHGWRCEITESESGGARFEFTGVEVVAE